MMRLFKEQKQRNGSATSADDQTKRSVKPAKVVALCVRSSMAENWEVKLRNDLLRKRGRFCEICGIRYATEYHHCIIHDDKRNARIHRILTCEENGMMTCSICHTSGEQTANNIDVRGAFVARQINRGYHIKKWYNELPIRVKEYWLLNLPEE